MIWGSCRWIVGTLLPGGWNARPAPDGLMPVRTARCDCVKCGPPDDWTNAIDEVADRWAREVER